MGWRDAPPVEQAAPAWAQAPAVEQPEPTTATGKAVQGVKDQPLWRRILRGGGLAGRTIAEGVVDVISPVANPAAWLINRGGEAVGLNPGLPENLSGQFSQTLTDIGVPETVGTGESLLNTAGRVGTGIAAGGAVNNAITGAMRQVPVSPYGSAAPTAEQVALQSGQRSGLVATPAAANPGGLAARLEGLGGKVKTAQMASIRNQPVIDRIAARAVGLGDDVPTEEGLRTIRAGAAQAYRVVRNAGHISPTNAFRSAIDDAVGGIRRAATRSSTLAAKNREVLGVADDLKSGGFDADTAVDLIIDIRDSASAAYRAGNSQQGAAYRSMADSMERLIERNLTARGSEGKEVLSMFRRARTLLAKTYTVEDALSRGHVNASSLVRQLERGKPLSGELRDLARFAQSFPRATRLPETIGGVSPWSVLDIAVAGASTGGAVASGNPAVAIPALVQAARPGIRNLLLSPAGQAMIQGGYLPSSLAGQVAGGGSAATNALMDDTRRRQSQ